MAAPTALSLIAVTFPRARRGTARGVYSAMASWAWSGCSRGLLVTYASWRWVFFVNVPIGLVVAVLATRVLPATGRRAGRFDLPGAITATAGVALLVYGLSNAATTPNGVSHWGDAKVVVSLAAAAVLLAAFAVIETRSRYALLPMRLLRSRDRSGTFGISLCTGTAILGMFFFLTVFIQEVWGYSALRTGLAYLPLRSRGLGDDGGRAAGSEPDRRPAAADRRQRARGRRDVLAVPDQRAQHVRRRDARPGTGPRGRPGPVFVPLSLVILNKVTPGDAGAASSLFNVGQQVGGSIGLAVVGTVAWSAVASSLRSQAAEAARAGVRASGARAAALQTRIYHHALATGFARGYLVSAGVLALAAIIALAMIRVRRQDLSGADPMPEPAGDATSPVRS